MAKNVGKLFGAAILNALGKGVEGYGTGAKEYREYALKELTEKQKSTPSIAKEVKWLREQPKDIQQTAYDLKTAGGGGRIKVGEEGEITKIPAPQQPRQPSDKELSQRKIAPILAIPPEQRTPEQRNAIKVHRQLYGR